MNRLIKDAAVGLSISGVGSLIFIWNGYSQVTVISLLYLIVVASVVQGIRYSETSFLNFDNPLRRLVIVVEGEEMKLKRIFTGEKYKIKGDVEKL